MSHIALDDGTGLVAVSSDYANKNLMRDMGGRWDASRMVWLIAPTLTNMDKLVESLHDLSIQEGVSDLMERMADGHQRIEQLKKISKSGEDVHLRIPGIKLPLYNYQKVGVASVMASGHGLLIADSMGLGKTIQGIASACLLKKQGKISNCLVVTPASLKWNWPIEIEKFTDETYVVVDGSPENRIVQWLREDVFFHVVNYELVLEDLFGGRAIEIKDDDSDKVKERKRKQIKEAKKRKRLLTSVRTKVWGMICADECHFLKRPTAKRSRNIKRLRGCVRVGLTGTPLDGKLEELHSVMEFIMPGILGSRVRFLDRYAQTDWYGKVVGYHRKDEVKEKIAPFFIRRLKEQVLKDLPPKIYQNRMVVMSAKEQRIYDSLASRAHELTEGSMIMTAIIRCKQFCDHPSLVEETCSSSKLEMFRSDIEDLVLENGNKVLVFSQYTTMAEILKVEMEKMGINLFYIWSGTKAKDRADMQKAFNEDNSIDVMLGSEAMSLGLNFQAATEVINYDDNWAPAIMAQREDRAHRHGQKKTVTVINYVCVNTVEERIRKALYAKSVVTDDILDDNLDESVLRRLGPKDVAKLL